MATVGGPFPVACSWTGMSETEHAKAHDHSWRVPSTRGSLYVKKARMIQRYTILPAEDGQGMYNLDGDECTRLLLISAVLRACASVGMEVSVAAQGTTGAQGCALCW
jgi:hypothetical protein